MCLPKRDTVQSRLIVYPFISFEGSQIRPFLVPCTSGDCNNQSVAVVPAAPRPGYMKYDVTCDMKYDIIYGCVKYDMTCGG